jgi:hypothetical protein
MIPTADAPHVTLTDPPLLMSSMSLVKLDPAGRLLEFAVVPPQVDGESASATGRLGRRSSAPPASISSSFKPVPSQWTPRVYADTRAAWTGPLPGLPNQQLRVEAASYRGRPVAFQQIAPWTRATRTAEVTGQQPVSIWSALGTLFVFSMCVGGGARCPAQPAEGSG